MNLKTAVERTTFETGGFDALEGDHSGWPDRLNERQ